MTTPAPFMWPATLPMTNLDWQLENMSRGGGPSLSGKEQIVPSASSRWSAKFDVVAGTNSEVATYQAILDCLEGRANPILLSPCQHTFAPAALANQPVEVRTKYSDGTTYSDGSENEQDATYAYLSGSFASRNGANALDTQLIIVCVPAPPMAGTFFSITPDFVENSRLHRIRRIYGSGTPWSRGFSSGFGPQNSVFAVEVQPPMRQAYPYGARLNFGRPVAPMRLTSDTAGSFQRVRNEWVKPNLSFVEVF